MSSKEIYLFTFLILFSFSNGTEIHSDSLHRTKRQLLFTNSTLLQFTMGIATPTPAALINFNWAFQANFQLPWNRSQIPVDVLVANSGYDGPSRKKREFGIEDQYSNDSRLYHFYKYIEGMLNGFGYNGTTCVLKTLCQLGAEPLHSYDDEDLLHEVVSFALDPRNDLDYIEYKSEINPYIEAYEKGESLEDCVSIYKPCKISLLDYFTKPHYT